MPLLISIVIPSYNAAGTLRQCLSSVLSQTYDNLEVICVNDGSTDGSAEILDELARQDRRIRVLHQRRSNAGEARNAGYLASHGDGLLFLDADDVFAQDMVETLVRGLIGHSADVAVCGWLDFADGEDVPELGHGAEDWKVTDFPASSVDVYSRWMGWAWNKLLRRELIEREGLRFQSLRSSNDLDFVFSALICARRVVQTPRRLVAHRKSPETLSATRDRDPLCFAAALRGHYAFLKRHGILRGNEALTRRFLHYVLVFAYWHLDTIKTDENYCKVYCELQRLSSEFSVARIVTPKSVRDEVVNRWRRMSACPTPIAYLRSEVERCASDKRILQEKNKALCNSRNKSGIKL